MNDLARQLLPALMPAPFNAADHYWFVAGDETQVYGSKRNIYVPVADADYLAWLDAGNFTYSITSEAEIWPCQQPIKPAWLFNGTTFAQPTVDTYTPEQLREYAKEQRWLNETGGITVGSTQVETDDRSKGLVSQQRLAAMNDSAGFSTDWQTVDNATHPLTAAQMIELADAVAAHVNDCFVQYADAIATIEGGTLTKLAQVDAKQKVPEKFGFLDLARKRLRHGG
jgi:hypothetical protein